jgi:hypothetical protein
VSTTSPGRADGAPPADSRSTPINPPRASHYQYWASLFALVLVSVGFGAISPSLANILAELAVTANLGSLLVSALGAGRLIGGSRPVWS